MRRPLEGEPTRYLCRIHDPARVTDLELASHPKGTKLLAVLGVYETENDEAAIAQAEVVAASWRRCDLHNGGSGEGTVTVLALALALGWLDDLGEPGCWREVASWELATPPE